MICACCDEWHLLILFGWFFITLFVGYAHPGSDYQFVVLNVFHELLDVPDCCFGIGISAICCSFALWLVCRNAKISVEDSWGMEVFAADCAFKIIF